MKKMPKGTSEVVGVEDETEDQVPLEDRTDFHISEGQRRARQLADTKRQIRRRADQFKPCLLCVETELGEVSALTDGLAWVLSQEGGYVNDPVDHGGATNFGVTQRTYNTWLAHKHLPPAEVKFLTHHDAADIMTDFYWKEFDGDRIAGLNPNLSTVMLDSAVQHSPRWASVTLQRVVGSEVDGEIGPATLAGVKIMLQNQGATVLLHGYLSRRLSYYQGIIARDPTQDRFRRGWGRRLNALCEKVGLEKIWETP